MRRRCPKASNSGLRAAIGIDISDPNGPSTLSKNLGTEIDITGKFQIKKDVKLQLGYSHLIATESMEAIKGVGSKDATNNWAWIMLDFKPTFLNWKKKS